MASSAVQQILTQTSWGRLDYLIIDMPPGTGDVPLTLAQTIPITGALIVTTPQKISFIDVVKGIQMFEKYLIRQFFLLNYLLKQPRKGPASSK